MTGSLHVVYSPQPALRQPWPLFQQMVKDLLFARELAWFLLMRNLRAQYRQSVLGFLWIVLQPLTTTAVWVLLNRVGVMNLGSTDTPYPLYVLIGTMLWQSFVEAINSPLKELTGARATLTKVNFPREALILAGFGEVILNTLPRIGLILAALIFFGIGLQVTVLLAPAAIIALLGLGVTIGILLVPVGLLYIDVQRALGIVTSLWFLVTPIVYAVPTDGPLALVGSLNPATPLLVTSRELFITGRPGALPQFFGVCGLTAICLLLGWLLYRVALPHVIERLSAK